MSFGPCTCDKPGHEVWCSAYDDGNMICPRCGFHLKSVEHNYCAVTNFNNSGIEVAIKMHQEAIDEIFKKK